MAAATMFNFNTGQRGVNAARGTVTLSSGAGTVTTPFTSVEGVLWSQQGATASAETLSYTASGGTVTIDSSDGASTSTYFVVVFGY